MSKKLINLLEAFIEKLFALLESQIRIATQKLNSGHSKKAWSWLNELCEPTILTHTNTTSVTGVSWKAEGIHFFYHHHMFFLPFCFPVSPCSLSFWMQPCWCWWQCWTASLRVDGVWWWMMGDGWCRWGENQLKGNLKKRNERWSLLSWKRKKKWHVNKSVMLLLILSKSCVLLG